MLKGKKKESQPRSLYAAKVFHRNEGEMKMLAVVGKIRAFDASKLTLKEWIKEIFK